MELASCAQKERKAKVVHAQKERKAKVVHKMPTPGSSFKAQMGYFRRMMQNCTHLYLSWKKTP